MVVLGWARVSILAMDILRIVDIQFQLDSKFFKQVSTYSPTKSCPASFAPASPRS